MTLRMIMTLQNTKTLFYQILKLSRPHSTFKNFSGPGKMDTFSKNLQGLVVAL